LKYCRHQVDAEETRLKELLLEKGSICRNIDRIETEIRDKETEKSQKKVFTSSEMQLFVNYIDSLMIRVYELTNELAELEARISSQQNRVIDARKRLKPVEKLKERKKIQYQFEANRELQALLDELHLVRYNRETA
jgi:flagellar export protein FliJ